MTPNGEHYSRRPIAGRNARRLAALGVALILGVAGFAAYVAFSNPSGVTTLVVYTYDSFLGGGCGAPGSAANAAVIGTFEAAHHVHLDLECPGGNLVSTLVAQANAPAADVVIGLDELTGPQAVAAGLLVPYSAPALSEMPAGLPRVLGGGGYLTPYEYGYLGIDYNDSFRSATHGAVVNWSFPAVAANSSWARGLLIEDPTLDITGEEFLLWEIAFYTQVLHQDWQAFWKTTDPYLPVAPDWSTGLTEFETPPDNPPMFVSYSTDSAYAAVNGGYGFNCTVGAWNGTTYGWQTVYGAGIVRGSAHPGLDRALVDWLLNGRSQSQLPLTEWEYPANTTVALPPAFDLAVPPTSIVALDSGNGASEYSKNLSTYLDAWQNLANQYG